MGRSIQEMYGKFKSLFEDDAFYYGCLILLVSLASFGLGRWSVLDQQVTDSTPSLVLTQQAAASESGAGSEEEPVENSSTVASEVTYVGSKNGTKYHLLWCPGAKQIKEENKVFFASKEEAQVAGYTPASNCKGI